MTYRNAGTLISITDITIHGIVVSHIQVDSTTAQDKQMWLISDFDVALTQVGDLPSRRSCEVHYRILLRLVLDDPY